MSEEKQEIKSARTGSTHLFLLRIWLEPREIEGALSEWRGRIEHVASGEGRYLKDLDEIAVFITPYLEKEDVKIKVYGRAWKWLRRWKGGNERD